MYRVSDCSGLKLKIIKIKPIQQEQIRPVNFSDFFISCADVALISQVLNFQQQQNFYTSIIGCYPACSLFLFHGRVFYTVLKDFEPKRAAFINQFVKIYVE
jgi:hypothetical protein